MTVKELRQILDGFIEKGQGGLPVHVNVLLNPATIHTDFTIREGTTMLDKVIHCSENDAETVLLGYEEFKFKRR